MPRVAELFRKHSYDYALGMVTVCFSSTVNREGETYATAMQNVDSMNVLKEGYCMVMFERRHRWCSARMIRDEDCVERAAEPCAFATGFMMTGSPFPQLRRKN